MARPREGEDGKAHAVGASVVCHADSLLAGEDMPPRRSPGHAGPPLAALASKHEVRVCEPDAAPLPRAHRQQLPVCRTDTARGEPRVLQELESLPTESGPRKWLVCKGPVKITTDDYIFIEFVAFYDNVT